MGAGELAASILTTTTNALIGLVAALHVYFLVLEMFLWDTPYGRRVFGSTPEFAKSAAIASKAGKPCASAMVKAPRGLRKDRS